MRSDGTLSKRDLATLDRAWDILSRWAEVAEAQGKTTDDYDYDMAMTACVGLCDFIREYCPREG